jgi:hypothetical protein
MFSSFCVLAHHELLLAGVVVGCPVRALAFSALFHHHTGFATSASKSVVICVGSAAVD